MIMICITVLEDYWNDLDIYNEQDPSTHNCEYDAWDGFRMLKDSIIHKLSLSARASLGLHELSWINSAPIIHALVMSNNCGQWIAEDSWKRREFILQHLMKAWWLSDEMRSMKEQHILVEVL